MGIQIRPDAKESAARDGFTVIVHGKHYHEETRATASQASLHTDGRYLCVRGVNEAATVCAFIRRELTAEVFRARFREAASRTSSPAATSSESAWRTRPRC